MNLRKILCGAAIALSFTWAQADDTIRFEWKDLVAENGPVGPGTPLLGPVNVVLTATVEDFQATGIRPSALTGLTLEVWGGGSVNGWSGRLLDSFQGYPLYYVPSIVNAPDENLCCNLHLWFQAGNVQFTLLTVDISTFESSASLNLDRFYWSEGRGGNGFFYTFPINHALPIVTQVPEPGTLGLLIIGLAALALAHRRRVPRQPAAHQAAGSFFRMASCLSSRTAT